MKTFDNRVNSQFATLAVFNVDWIDFQVAFISSLYFLCNKVRVNQYLTRLKLILYILWILSFSCLEIGAAVELAPHLKVQV